MIVRVFSTMRRCVENDDHVWVLGRDTMWYLHENVDFALQVKLRDYAGFLRDNAEQEAKYEDPYGRSMLAQRLLPLWYEKGEWFVPRSTSSGYFAVRTGEPGEWSLRVADGSVVPREPAHLIRETQFVPLMSKKGLEDAAAFLHRLLGEEQTARLCAVIRGAMMAAPTWRPTVVFEGPPESGKTTLARIITRVISDRSTWGEWRGNRVALFLQNKESEDVVLFHTQATIPTEEKVHPNLLLPRLMEPLFCLLFLT